MSTSDAVAAPRRKTFWQRVLAWVSAALGIIALIGSLFQLKDSFFPSLPGCTSAEASGALRNIFKAKKLALAGLTNLATVSDGSSEETCRADYALANETGTLTYRIYWQGDSPTVQITGAKPK